MAVNIPKYKNILQGEYYVSSQPDFYISTILGSCVATFITDPEAQIGGLNHFLLPDSTGNDRQYIKYGAYLMELLINDMIKQGGKKERFQAKVFGGAKMLKNLSDIGEMNAQFALKFIHNEGILNCGGSTGGTSARKIRAWPQTGRIQQVMLAMQSRHLVDPVEDASFRL